MSIKSFWKPQRWTSEKYLDFIRKKACTFGCVTIADDNGKRSEPHHLREIFKSGLSTKPGDHLSIPVCRSCHELLENKRHPEFDETYLTLVTIDLITEYLCTNNIR
jgi:hypothetical protein